MLKTVINAFHCNRLIMLITVSVFCHSDCVSQCFTEANVSLLITYSSDSFNLHVYKKVNLRIVSDYFIALQLE